MTLFLRIDNHRFFSRPDNIETNGRIFNVKSKVYSKQEYKIARKASELIGNSESQTFIHKNRKWKVVKINENSLIRRILRHLFPFSMKPAEGRFERYEVKRCFFSFGKETSGTPGIYESRTYNSLSSFTRIAARANQRHECNFNPSDDIQGDSSQFVLVLKDNQINLVKKDSKENDEGERNAALDAWQKDFIAMHGRRKYDQIVDFYKLDFADGLTPELIYRANIGSTNIEHADIVDFVERFTQDGELTLREQKALKGIRDTQALKESLIQENLTPRNFSIVCSVLEFSSKEKEMAYTGKKIALPIATNYTMAAVKKYKPWIDQQELTQISEKLKACTSVESYQELLSHVVVKKHLLRVDENGPRLGAILPAPMCMGSGYYAVTHCISNGANMCFTLENPAGDTTLPTILLFRSTATDLYAMNWSDTIVNDFNHLNSPGYLGAYTIDPYMRAFIKERTIPLWVGYLHRANECQDALKKAKWLEKAVEALGEEIEKRNVPLDFTAILKKHDQLLNTIFFPFMAGDLRTFIKRYRKDILANMIERHVYKKGSPPGEDRLMKDAARLRELAEKIKRKKGADYPAISEQADHLLNDLDKYIFNQNEQGMAQSDYDLMAKISQAQRDGDLDQLTTVLSDHAEQLQENIDSKRSSNLFFTGQSLGGGCAQVAIARYMAQDGRMPLPDRSCKGFFFQEPGINRDDVEAFAAYGNKHHKLFHALGVKYHIYKRHEAGDGVTAGGEMGLGAVSSKSAQKKQKKWLHYDAAVNSRSKKARPVEIAENPMHGARWLDENASPRPASVKVDGRRITRTKSQMKERDYTETVITPYVEGLYNRGSLGELEGKEKSAYKKLYSKVWQLSPRLESIISESARKSMKLPFMILRKTLNNGSEFMTHTLPKSCLDVNGAFAWNLNGPIPFIA